MLNTYNNREFNKGTIWNADVWNKVKLKLLLS